MGRPRKEDEQRNEEKPQEQESRPSLRHKVVVVGDYMVEARQEYGPDNIWANAVALLYEKNTVVAILNHKGEDKFLVLDKG